ncbi:alpha-1B adrenergic receptor [Cylas formicarius]|uniref:alpha-1B adrenergic receptor n=1 Tax=Cylas formicarius TaxID=197179 RepID=UPI0029584FEA|nr:alpha-1B adrenergic receptor [Cylas formicarius]XP_060533847.1 alpha-1B adrenergic receptor [Cylas formicarius]
MESDYHWLVTVALVTSSVIAVTANAFLLLVFARRRGLRTVPNRFIINLLITNLLSSLLLIPLLLVDQKSLPASFNSTMSVHINKTFEEDVVIKEEIISPGKDLRIVETSEKLVTENLQGFIFSNRSDDHDLLCYFAQASTSFVCTASIFSILLIGINQYIGVIHSLRYHFYVNKGRSNVLIASSWLAALLCAVLSTVTYSDGSLWHFCGKRSDEDASTRTLNTIYAFGYFFFVILAPFVAICIIYLCIYTAAHQSSERMRKSTSAASPLDSIQVPPEGKKFRGLPKVHSAPNFTHLNCREVCSDETRDRNSFITNLKHKLSNASVFRYREETRAAKISILVIFMVLVCYVPYGLTLVLTSGCIEISPGQIFNYLSLVLLVFSNVMSPFLFGYRNKRVKREIARIFATQKAPEAENHDRQATILRNRSFGEVAGNSEPLLSQNRLVPEVIVTCKVENESKSILKRVGSGWASYKKCSFITVPDSCLGDARGSFSSASTQISSDE